MSAVNCLRSGDVRVLIESLNASFERLSSSLPPRGLKELASSFQALTFWMVRYYDTAIEAAASDPDPAQSVNRIDREFARILREIQRNCSGFIHPTGTEDFPDELAVWAKFWICEFGGHSWKGTSVALFPQWAFVSEVIGFPNPLQSFVKELEDRLLLDHLGGFDDELAKHPQTFLLFGFA